MKNVELPNKLSELLRLAVKDSQEIEKTPGYVLSMLAWHESVDAQCCVCMAGAVLANTLKFPKNGTFSMLFIEPHVSNETMVKMSAINHMRAGDFYAAASVLNKAIPERVLISACAPIETSYSFGRKRASWEAYLKAADLLEKEGF